MSWIWRGGGEEEAGAGRGDQGGIEAGVGGKGEEGGGADPEAKGTRKKEVAEEEIEVEDIEVDEGEGYSK